jgi:hypothetical protein
MGLGGLLRGVMWGSDSDGRTVYVPISDSFANGKPNPDAGGLVARRNSEAASQVAGSGHADEPQACEWARLRPAANDST